jgi:hypothetical protein
VSHALVAAVVVVMVELLEVVGQAAAVLDQIVVAQAQQAQPTREAAAVEVAAAEATAALAAQA